MARYMWVLAASALFRQSSAGIERRRETDHARASPAKKGKASERSDENSEGAIRVLA
jgi:hypothetical protein